ncbi:MAG TPA: M56 family metallopeptidase, partial [Thermoanaerobaculaceae bacterium]|nr:M56 family metallopeptidase [Thermoanaerobaculaceae bacterium]
WLPRLAARSRHLVLVSGLLLAVLPARGWLEAVRLTGLDPAAWFHRPAPVATLSTAAVVMVPPAEPAPAPTPRPGLGPCLAGAWLLGVAAALGVGWRRGRMGRANGMPVSIQEQSVLDLAREWLGVRRRVAMERRADARVPCARGLWRPLIVLPASDNLTPDELAAVVAHEVAHVARHDVGWAAVAGVARAVLWFHPLAWWVAARVAREAECACDALVTARVASVSVYLASLAKVCRHAVRAPLRASCASGGALSERMARMEREHALMQQPRWPAFAIVAALVLVPLTVASATGQPKPRPVPYTWSASVSRASDGTLACDARVVDASSGEVVMEPRVFFRGRDLATAKSGTGELSFVIEVQATSDSEAQVTFRARNGDKVLQEETIHIPIARPEEELPLAFGNRMQVQADGTTVLTVLAHDRDGRAEVWRHDFSWPLKGASEATGSHGPIAFRVVVRPLEDGSAAIEVTLNEPGRPAQISTSKVYHPDGPASETTKAETHTYGLRAGMERRPDGQLELHFRVVVAAGADEVMNGAILMPLVAPLVRGVPHGDDRLQVRAEPVGEGTVRLTLEVLREDQVVETSRAAFNFLQPEDQPLAAVALPPSATVRPYAWSVDLARLPARQLVAAVQVRDAATGSAIWRPALRFAVSGSADASARVGDVWLHLHARGVDVMSSTLDLEVVRGGEVLQREFGSFKARQASGKELQDRTTSQPLYALGLRWKVLGHGKTLCLATVTRSATGEVLMEMEHTLGRDDSASDTKVVGGHTLTFKVETPGRGPGKVELVVTQGDAVIERQGHSLTAPADTRRATGPPHPDGIQMHLDGARLGDVLTTFEHVTGHPVQAEVPVDAKVTVWLDDVPWPDALRQVLAQAGLVYTFDGRTIRVRKP